MPNPLVIKINHYKRCHHKQWLGHNTIMYYEGSFGSWVWRNSKSKLSKVHTHLKEGLSPPPMCGDEHNML
ncbi:hypothetical protein GDO81_016577 [Engystomops pustulosus]|uniref:Uncharacterized protein n=1 Tax=Engystomops pustulosus TaxID=76066 RepID=A0AAV7AT56_ENGPU|nr:hypothetical protein GDO81_016577 [Engystomops pustulosus]